MNKHQERWRRKNFEQFYGWKKPKPKEPKAEVTESFDTAPENFWWTTGTNYSNYIMIDEDQYNALVAENQRLKEELARRSTIQPQLLEEHIHSVRMFRLNP